MTLPAGPDLDRAVAELVMGWAYAGVVQRTRGQGGPVDSFTDADGRCRWFQPSTNIAHAFEVVERMAPREMRMGRLPTGRYYVNFDFQPMNEVADTAPLAICLAALAACGPKGQ